MKAIDINMNNIDFLDIIYATPQYETGNVMVHQHEYLEIHMITGGKGWMRVNHELIPVEANTLIMSFPGDYHCLQTAKDCPFFLQYMLPCKINEPNDDFTHELYKNFRHGKQADNGNVYFQKIERLFNSGNQRLALAAQKYLNAFILEHMSEKNPENFNEFVEKAKEYLRQNADKKYCLDNLSKFVGLEKSYFCRLFKRFTGKSPRQFFIKQKIELTKELLTKGKSNAFIADLTGFSDEFHFSRTFKKITGSSPRTYRKK